ncbi:MAG: hypothetical protein PVG03_09150 [Desulfarculaceae bacterium]|jgi:hypothetical protein
MLMYYICMNQSLGYDGPNAVVQSNGLFNNRSINNGTSGVWQSIPTKLQARADGLDCGGVSVFGGAGEGGLRVAKVPHLLT